MQYSLPRGRLPLASGGGLQAASLHGRSRRTEQGAKEMGGEQRRSGQLDVWMGGIHHPNRSTLKGLVEVMQGSQSEQSLSTAQNIAAEIFGVLSAKQRTCCRNNIFLNNKNNRLLTALKRAGKSSGLQVVEDLDEQEENTRISCSSPHIPSSTTGFPD